MFELFCNSIGRELSRTLPNRERETYTYNVYGQVATHVDFDGNAAASMYQTSGPQAGLLQKVVYTAPAGSGKATQEVDYTYDAMNRRYQVTDASGTTTDGYDAWDNLSSQVTPAGTVSYTTDPATGELTGILANGGGSQVETDYEYDARGRLTSSDLLGM